MSVNHILKLKFQIITAFHKFPTSNHLQNTLYLRFLVLKIKAISKI